MKEGVLLSWLSVDHDPFYSNTKRGAVLDLRDGVVPGPSLRLVTDPEWGERFQRYFVFHQQEHTAQAEALREVINEQRKDLVVDLRNVGELDPIDHAAIFAKLSPLIHDIVHRWPHETRLYPPNMPVYLVEGQDGLEEVDGYHLDASEWGKVVSILPQETLGIEPVSVCQREYFANISQGTPAMHAIWLVLVQAGILKAKLLQTKPERFRKKGESLAQEVVLDVGKLPMPAMRNLEVGFVRDYRARKSLGPVAVMSDFMNSRDHREDNSYGLYRITHTPASELSIRETLSRITDDVKDVEEYLSDTALVHLKQYILEAKRSLGRDYEAYKEWFGASAEQRRAFKSLFRFSLRSWEAEMRSLFGNQLDVETEWNEDAQMLPDIYCEAEAVKRGLDAIVENAAEHSAVGGAKGRLYLTITREVANLKIVLQDSGKGIPNLASRFRRAPEATGNGMSDIKRLAKWFDIEVVSTCSLAYLVRQDEERLIDSTPGTGTRYTLSCQLAPTLASNPS